MEKKSWYELMEEHENEMFRRIHSGSGWKKKNPSSDVIKQPYSAGSKDSLVEEAAPNYDIRERLAHRDAIWGANYGNNMSARDFHLNHMLERVSEDIARNNN